MGIHWERLEYEIQAPRYVHDASFAFFESIFLPHLTIFRALIADYALSMSSRSSGNELEDLVGKSHQARTI